MKKPLCVYVDNSNIYIGGQTIAEKAGEDPVLMRIFFKNFIFLVTEGMMEFDEMVWGGSGPEGIEEIFTGMKTKGVDLQIIPRKNEGENETVDMAIQLSMYRHNRKYREAPGTIVLCTGDGKGYEDEKGFLYDLQAFAEDGWKIHVYSWDCACHAALKDFASRFGKYHSLEEHYKAITFIEGGRKAEPVKINRE